MLIHPNQKIKLLIFLWKHNNEKFTYSELKELNFLNGSNLSSFLKWTVAKKIIKKTNGFWFGKKKKVMYEIKDNANIFAEWLDYCVN